MAIITTGKTFGTTDPVTSVDLNNVANAATFNDPVDETSLELITSGVGLIGKLGIKDGGVTKAKIENVANLRVLGNTSGSAVAPQEVEILDDDTMATADAATLATSESIKAYVDGEITDHGITQTTGTAPYFGCRCFGIFNGTLSTPITPESSGNVASIVRTSTGFFEVSFTTPMAAANYSVVVTANHHASITYATSGNVGFRQTGKFQIFFGSSSSLYNPGRISFAVFG
tara:strand:+ start:30 stop:719 length:690 start_codon:yes stop_codon:yes gene_type:complete